jgi:hypothetical protein
MSNTNQALTEIRDAPNLAPSLESYRCEIVAEPGAEWDRLASEFADMCLEQTTAFAGARFGAARSTGVILREAAGFEPVGMALAVVATLPVIGLGLAYVKFGPLWRRRGAPARPEHLGLMLEALKREFAQKRGLAIRVMPPADPGYEQEWKHALARANFAFQAGAPDPVRYLVDLTLSEGDQLKSLGSKWRYNLAKSAIDELDIREVGLEEGLPEFLALHRHMLSRKHTTTAMASRIYPRSPRPRGRRSACACSSPSTKQSPWSARSSSARASACSCPSARPTKRRWSCVPATHCAGPSWNACAVPRRADLDLGGAEGDQGLNHYKLGNVGKRGRVVEIPGEFDFAPNALAAGTAKAIMLGKELARSKQLKMLVMMLPI